MGTVSWDNEEPVSIYWGSQEKDNVEFLCEDQRLILAASEMFSVANGLTSAEHSIQ